MRPLRFALGRLALELRSGANIAAICCPLPNLHCTSEAWQARALCHTFPNARPPAQCGAAGALHRPRGHNLHRARWH